MNWQKRRVRKQPLARAARAALQMEGAERSEVSIVLADDEAIHALNRDYRHHDRPTDVLSFPQRDVAPGAPPAPAAPGVELLGDVVVSVDTAARQAQQHGVTLEREMALLVVHGVLHLLGYDDATEEGAEEMRRREQAALAAVE